MIPATHRLITGLFLLLLAGSVIFYLERMLFVDASFILFRIINLDSLQIQEHRYGSFITQSVPLLAAKAGLPLQVIVILYSASFNIFYLAVVLLLVWKFRETGLAILMSFYYILFVSDAYFWTNNEVHQGMAWMFLFFGATRYMLKRKTSPLLVLPLFTTLAFLALFTHPLVLFPTLFLWLYFLVSPGWPAQRKWTIVLSLLLLAICVARFMLSTAEGSHYDAEKLHATTHLSFKKIFGAFVSPMAKEILVRSLWNYWLVPLLFFTGALVAWKEKQYRQLLLVVVFSLGYFVALCLTFENFIPFYTESEWMPGTVIFTALFVFMVLPRLKEKTAFLLLAGIFLVRLVYIGEASGKWVERNNWILSRLDQMEKLGISKGIVYENEENREILVMNWGVPTESLLASAIRGEQPHKTFVVDTRENMEWRSPKSTHDLVMPFEIWPSSRLNPRYFVTDSSAAYQVLP